ncbi:hypothetical protein SLS62_007006 [Diatrype stigma]|uniref:Uncharacterized protein n=1 Tax=Diatrype stigma TaxID=117547 RepID=A0AAN9UPZ8_9PEZI
MPRVPFGVPHKKKGPKPFPGSKRTRCDLRVPPTAEKKPRKPTTRHSKRRKTQVLEWLIRHRIAEQRARPSDLYHAVRSRSGEALISYEEMRDRKIVWERGGVVYRTPTYRDAAKHWRINAGVIVAWWQNKEKYLPKSEIERISARHPLTGCSFDPIPNMPRPPPPLMPTASGAPGGTQSTPIELDGGDDDASIHPDAVAEREAEERQRAGEQVDDYDDDDDDEDDDDDIDLDINSDIDVGDAEMEDGEDEDEDQDEDDGGNIDVDQNVDGGRTELQSDGIEHTEQFREFPDDFEDALGEDDPDMMPQDLP